MISWTKLLTEDALENDDLRYSKTTISIPKIVVWNATQLCNLSCQHCYFASTQKPNPNELNSEEAEVFITDLAKLKVAVLLFSGGEPLLRKDIFQLAQFATDKGIKTVLSTNGTLITEKIAEKIKRAGFSYVGISLDGTERNNDYFRRRKGAFSQSLSGIINCQRQNLKVGLRFTLTKFNFKDLPAIFDLVESFRIIRLCLYHLVYSGRGNNLINQDLNNAEKRDILEFVWQKTFDFAQKKLNIEVLTVDNHADGVWIYLKLKKVNLKRASQAYNLLKLQGGNNSGIKLAAVDNLGNVYADQFLSSLILGNIRQKSFSEIWKDSVFLSQLRKRHLFLKGRCVNCYFLSICNGNLRSRAKAVFGDVWQEDPACYLTDEEIYRDERIYSPPSSVGVNA